MVRRFARHARTIVSITNPTTATLALRTFTAKKWPPSPTSPCILPLVDNACGRPSALFGLRRRMSTACNSLGIMQHLRATPGLCFHGVGKSRNLALLVAARRSNACTILSRELHANRDLRSGRSWGSGMNKDGSGWSFTTDEVSEEEYRIKRKGHIKRIREAIHAEDKTARQNKPDLTSIAENEFHGILAYMNEEERILWRIYLHAFALYKTMSPEDRAMLMEDTLDFLDCLHPVSTPTEVLAPPIITDEELNRPLTQEEQLVKSTLEWCLAREGQSEDLPPPMPFDFSGMPVYRVRAITGSKRIPSRTDSLCWETLDKLSKQRQPFATSLRAERAGEAAGIGGEEGQLQLWRALLGLDAEAYEKAARESELAHPDDIAAAEREKRRAALQKRKAIEEYKQLHDLSLGPGTVSEASPGIVTLHNEVGVTRLNRSMWRSKANWAVQGDPSQEWLAALHDAIIDADSGCRGVLVTHELELKESRDPLFEVTPALMAQAHATMAVMGARWCHLCLYSANESAIFRIEMNDAYWRDLYYEIASFWFQAVVPAKVALANDDVEEQPMDAFATGARSDRVLRGAVHTSSTIAPDQT
eukprot:scaffold2083_cov419-Prasinococcus_capsulatus_cf.AAC.1